LHDDEIQTFDATARDAEYEADADGTDSDADGTDSDADDADADGDDADADGTDSTDAA
jgi:hypothetical protein